MAYPLSMYLQKVNVDLASAMEAANNLSVLIKVMHSNVQSKFHDLFRTAEELAKEIGEDIKIPRVTQF
jgi:transcriptional regulatory protein LevR